MDNQLSWTPHHHSGHPSSEVVEAEPLPDIAGGNETHPPVSIDALLPDDILERILACLPVAGIFRAGSVCKRWHDIIKSKRFLWNFSSYGVQKPWYFMFTSNDIATGYVYDPSFQKWYGGIDLPCIESSSWIISSSSGLVCFMDNDSSSRSKIYVCNPITKRWRGIGEPPGVEYSCYSSLALSVDRNSHSYRVVIANSRQVPDDFLQWEFSIHTYDSNSGSWVPCVKEVFTGWRGGAETVVCNGILYCLIYSTGPIYSTGVLGNSELRHGLIMYNLSKCSCYPSLLDNSVPVPCPLTCGRLMNLQEKLILVGGIGKQDRPDIIKGIGIWKLEARQWKEVSRMPHRFFQGFGELDDVFASSGTEDLIYIQSYGAPALLVFDLGQNKWKWSMKCPVTKRFPLQLFTGFCFEPRLEVSP